ncbi:protein FAM161A isoform X1 [Sarcophilus harrisii]|uniref:Protein FAM161A n=2 Tax=Sarcophilus harrisii TaxID=9305 RepID=G3W4M6_SARHA|nr:protein FAM161A isoform X1 [Sarcophilus harrisii]
MDASGRAAALASFRYRAPLNPRSGSPGFDFYEQERAGETAEEESNEEEDDFETDISMVDEQSLHENRSYEDLVSTSEICDSNQEYFRKLEELKAAHMKTMAKLEKLYQNKLYIKGVQPDTTKEQMPGPCFSSVWINSYQPAILQKSFSESDLNQPSISVSDLSEHGFSNIEKENMNEVKMMTSAKEYIKNMWNDFSVKDYAYTHSDSSDSPIVEKPQKKPKEWVPKITVPKPFQMTIREERKKKEWLKSRSETEMAFKLMNKQEGEVVQKRRFRANPVPESVFLPLYHEILERNEERKKSVKERSKKILLASQKPFTFIAREEQKKEARKGQLAEAPKPEKRKNPFKAKPVPRSTYSPPLSDRLKEEAFFREIRVHLRAQKLLQNSSLPRTMQTHQSPSRRKPEHMAQGEKPRRRNKASCRVPDFERLHTKLQKQLLEHKNPRPTTVCEPFDLLTLRIPSKKEKILEDIQADEERLKETRWPYLSPRGKVRTRCSRAEHSLCESSESESPRPTVSSRRRQQAIRRSLEEKKTLEEDRKRNLAKQRQRMRELQKLLVARARAIDTHQSLAQMSKSRMTTLRKNEKERMKEYLQELEEIEKRLKKRPLLFERVAQKNARVSAEKKYSKTLRGLGLCDEFVSKKGQNAEYLTDQEIENYSEDEISLDGDKVGEHWGENDQDGFVSQDDLNQDSETHEDSAEENSALLEKEVGTVKAF